MEHLSRAKDFWKIAGGFPIDKELCYPEHRIAQQFDDIRDKSVLEYGCGGGSDTLSYLRRGNRVYYADIVAENVTLTGGRVTLNGFSENARAVVLTASTPIPLKDATMDVVSSHGVVHHIKDPDPVVRELYRVLKPGGAVYVMLYTEKLRRDLDEEVKKGLAKGLSEPEAFGHATDGLGCPWAVPYSVLEGKRLLESAGFTVTSTFEYNNGQFRTFRGVKQ